VDIAVCPAETTTTTTTPPCVGGCGDVDLCTVDSCDGTGCVHTPLTGLPSVTCACASTIAACEGEPVPTGVRNAVTNSCSLVARAEEATGQKAVKKLLRKASRGFKRGVRLVGSRRTRKKIAPECASAFGEHLTTLRSPLVAVASP